MGQKEWKEEGDSLQHQYPLPRSQTICAKPPSLLCHTARKGNTQGRAQAPSLRCSFHTMTHLSTFFNVAMFARGILRRPGPGRPGLVVALSRAVGAATSSTDCEASGSAVPLAALAGAGEATAPSLAGVCEPSAAVAVGLPFPVCG